MKIPMAGELRGGISEAGRFRGLFSFRRRAKLELGYSAIKYIEIDARTMPATNTGPGSV